MELEDFLGALCLSVSVFLCFVLWTYWTDVMGQTQTTPLLIILRMSGEELTTSVWKSESVGGRFFVLASGQLSMSDGHQRESSTSLPSTESGVSSLGLKRAILIRSLTLSLGRTL